MDNRYAINVAKTKLREAYSKADIDGILAIYSDSFTDMREGQASFFNVDAKAALRNRLTKLFREQDVELIPTIIGINKGNILAGTFCSALIADCETWLPGGFTF